MATMADVAPFNATADGAHLASSPTAAPDSGPAEADHGGVQELRLLGVDGGVVAMDGKMVVVPRNVQCIPAETLFALHTSRG